MKGELIVSVRGEQSGGARQYAFPHPFALVGPSPECNIRLSAGEVDGRSVLLCAIGEQIVPIEFCGSTDWNGTGRTGGGPGVVCRPPAAASGLRIGSSIIDAVWVAADGRIAKLGEPISLTQNMESQDLGFRFLNAFSRRKRNQVRRLREKITLIGRTAPCHLKLADPRIPKVQCTVTRVGGRVALNNLGREGLLRLNGDEVDSAFLSEGDELVIGTFRMQFWCSEPAHEDHAQEVVAGGLVPEGPAQLQAVLNGLSAAVGQVGFAPFETDDEGFHDEAGWSVASSFERLVATQQMLVAEAQKQTRLFENLVAMLAQNHRETVQRDLQRSERIAGEIQRLRSQLPLAIAPGNFGVVREVPPGLTSPDVAAGPDGGLAGGTPRTSADTRIHSAIEERIHALETERRSCLRRVLRLIAGKDL